jgi:hypothetical protein
MLTDLSAHSDFVNARLNGVDTTNNIFNSNGSSNDGSSKPKTLYYIIGGAVLGGLLLIIVGGLLVKRSRSRQRGVYRPLHLPAPGAGNPQMYQQQPMYAQTQPYGAGPPAYNPDRPYDPPQERVPYHNPWEGRRQ